MRSCAVDLLSGAFNSMQVDEDFETTVENHRGALVALDLPQQLANKLTAEHKRVLKAIFEGKSEMLKILPGKQLLGMLADILTLKNVQALTELTIEALRNSTDTSESVSVLGRNSNGLLANIYLHVKSLQHPTDRPFRVNKSKLRQIDRDRTAHCAEAFFGLLPRDAALFFACFFGAAPGRGGLLALRGFAGRRWAPEPRLVCRAA